jgi:hypothetical protein
VVTNADAFEAGLNEIDALKSASSMAAKDCADKIGEGGAGVAGGAGSGGGAGLTGDVPPSLPSPPQAARHNEQTTMIKRHCM